MITAKVWTRLFWIALGVAGISSLGQAQAEGEASENVKLTISPMVRYIEVDGNESLFESHYWMPEGFSGGIESLVYESRSDDGDYLRVDGQGIYGEHDYELVIQMYPSDGGKLEIGASNYRKYFDQAGWYAAGGPEHGAYVRDNKDLHLDIGKAWVAYTMQASENLTLTIAYEYAYKKGSKSSTVYGATMQGGTQKNIYPSYTDVDEDVHTISLELEYTNEGLTVVNYLSYQNFHGDTNRVDVVPPGPSGANFPAGHRVQEDYSSDQIVYAIAIDKWLNDWMVVGVGYMYLWQDGELSFNIDQPDLRQGPFNHDDHTNGPLDTDEYSHTLNLSLMMAPNPAFQFISGVQAEYGKVRVDGDYTYIRSGFGPLPSPLTIDPSSYVERDQMYASLEESFELRFKLIPASTLYARATFEQERWELQELETHGGLMRETDTDRDTQKYRVGFNTRPISGLVLNAYYQKIYQQDDYTHDLDSDPNGYSAFIEQTEYEADEVGVRLSLQHTSWLQTNYKYTFRKADREIQTEKSPMRADTMNYDAHIVTAGFVLTPSDGLVLSSMVNYQNTRLSLPEWRNDLVEDYQPETWSFINNATMALDEKTTLECGYRYLVTDGDQDGAVFPAGYNYEQHAVTVGLRHWFTDDLEGYVNYGLYTNQDFDRGDAGDYTAHVVSTGVAMTF